MNGRPTRVAAITGFSGAGKTTMIIALIASFLRDGARVGAIKHTHHPLNEENRGDTGRFRAAGANPVILAGSGAAVVFSDSGTRRVAYEKPEDLLEHFVDGEVVLVEGFKQLGSWPQISISAEARPTVAEMRATLDRIWSS